MSTTNKLEMENALENLKIELCNNINFTVDLSNKIKNMTETKFAHFSKTLSDLDNGSKVRLKELQKSLSIFTTETQDNVRELREFVKRLYAEVEEDFKVRIENVNEQLKDVQNNRKAADQRIYELQQLIENRIFPNTFNKDVAVIVFLAVVAFVLFLTFCVYTLRSALEESKSDIATLKKELKGLEATLKQEHSYGTGGNEVPGRMS
ncbi:uncharacterized protein LOC123561134 [Mercenaria mercenaria]|uniref:uncharacterized protein LOC123561134 n=1 Tax=Mercenaria mercenaria TaxID=6596 RepID=UPI00234ED5B7|nr:uncharacterized protein LOC123561134 [Mercenaria mercenaria]